MRWEDLTKPKRCLIQVCRRRNGGVVLHARLYYVALVQGDQAAQIAKKFHGTRTGVRDLQSFQSDTGLALAHGQRKTAREIYTR